MRWWKDTRRDVITCHVMLVREDVRRKYLSLSNIQLLIYVWLPYWYHTCLLSIRLSQLFDYLLVAAVTTVMMTDNISWGLLVTSKLSVNFSLNFGHSKRASRSEELDNSILRVSRTVHGQFCSIEMQPHTIRDGQATFKLTQIKPWSSSFELKAWDNPKNKIQAMLEIKLKLDGVAPLITDPPPLKLHQ